MVRFLRAIVCVHSTEGRDARGPQMEPDELMPGTPQGTPPAGEGSARSGFAARDAGGQSPSSSLPELRRTSLPEASPTPPARFQESSAGQASLSQDSVRQAGLPAPAPPVRPPAAPASPSPPTAPFLPGPPPVGPPTGPPGRILGGELPEASSPGPESAKWRQSWFVVVLMAVAAIGAAALGAVLYRQWKTFTAVPSPAPVVAQPTPSRAPLRRASRADLGRQAETPTPSPTPTPTTASPTLLRAVLYGQVTSFRAPTPLRGGVLTLRTTGFTLSLFAERTLAVRVALPVFERTRGALKLSIPVGRLVVLSVLYDPSRPYTTLTARSVTSSVGPKFRTAGEENETSGAENFGPGAPSVLPLSGGT